ncbi:MAG: acetylxylan esterase [Verrucomicrobiales bacterium]|nr:acetylxylan esterase [Verrucomicrobiales bacterium]
MKLLLSLLLFLITGSQCIQASDFTSIPTEPTIGDAMLTEYFERETRRLAQRTDKIVSSEEDWNTQSLSLRRQLFEMLGLQPLPARSPLKPVITGTITHDGVIIEKLQFQSRPGLYVTANFYRPEKQDGPLPTILYVCGHGRKMDGKISLGNKAHYQHHPLWFARNGYTCLIIDTLQLGEIEGIHHGTHRMNRWWWNARGYTPAGVEAWNGIRALDYLETRPEVDKEKFGITGRSGGGAYTYWIAALDTRIKVAAPVAGITSMKNHVVDGCIEGHCDCMFMVNTYRWDFPLLASLIAPRPMLILNTDSDRIFPTDGVVDVYTKTAMVYDRLGERDALGLAFYQGPHKDTQPLRVSAFHWFERHLKGKSIDYEIPDTTAKQELDPKQLRVLEKIPGNERNTAIDEYFTRRTPRRPVVPETEQDWRARRALTISRLKSKSFRGWPSAAEDTELSREYHSEKDGMTFTRYTYNSQNPFRLPLYLIHREGLAPEELDLIVLNVLDEKNWNEFLSSMGATFPEAFPGIEIPEQNKENYDAEVKMHRNMKWGMAYLPPRGIGPTSWTNDEKEATHIRRRFALLGQTLDGMRVWDIRRGIQSLRSIEGADKLQLWLQSSGEMGGNALYASLFEKDIHRLDLHNLPDSHRTGPEYLNILRFVDIPETVGFVAKTSQVRLYTDKPDQWKYPVSLAEKYKWEGKPIEVRDLTEK